MSLFLLNALSIGDSFPVNLQLICAHPEVEALRLNPTIPVIPAHRVKKPFMFIRLE
ncbi:MAG TPA: hypothetical protein VHZ76_08085 [Gammaproteobacteria bacterium]|jgi:hypothetical protein|nr:hypothetical protein [Gammaproteobacteria bacterium]